MNIEQQYFKRKIFKCLRINDINCYKETITVHFNGKCSIFSQFINWTLQVSYIVFM